MAGKVTNARIVVTLDPDPDLSYLEDESRYRGVPPEEARKYREQDRRRLETYGDLWNMIGIYAEAEVDVRGTLQRMRSGGLWGIESDSDKKHIESISKEEYDALKAILKDTGAKGLPAFKSLEVVDR